MVGQDLDGWRALDAFGGSGLLGFEAFSRGAEVMIIDRDPKVVRRIKQSAGELGATVKVRRADAAAILAKGVWDLVLLDPPYAEDPAVWLERAASAASEVLVIEHDSQREVPAEVGGLVMDRQRRYGSTTLSLYRPR
ncbi:MAG: 16S rRNA (guanine966-N2)-methyltransferase [Myxococcota bacterium]|jgi:16S rRNA (guanine966-N2)-methyltransferase